MESGVWELDQGQLIGRWIVVESCSELVKGDLAVRIFAAVGEAMGLDLRNANVVVGGRSGGLFGIVVLTIINSLSCVPHMISDTHILRLHSNQAQRVCHAVNDLDQPSHAHMRDRTPCSRDPHEHR